MAKPPGTADPCGARAACRGGPCSLPFARPAALGWAGIGRDDVPEVVVAEDRREAGSRVDALEERSELGRGGPAEGVRRSLDLGSTQLPDARVERLAPVSGRV